MRSLTQPHRWPPRGGTIAKGHRSVLNGHDACSGCSEHKHTGRRVELHKKGDVFVMKVNVPPMQASSKTGGAVMDFDVVCELGFAWQVD